MKILRYLFSALICLSFISTSFSQELPTLEAEWTLTSNGPNTGTGYFDSGFKVFGTSDIPASSIVKVVIVAEIIDLHNMIEIEAWEAVSGYYCNNVHIDIAPTWYNPKIAVITATFDNYSSSLSNNYNFESCSEAEVMLLSGEGACGIYGIDILNSGTYVRYFDGSSYINVTPIIVDKIVDDPCDSPGPPNSARMVNSNNDQIDNFNETQIYPNPAYGKVTIQSTEESHIQIYNLSGKLILEKQAAQSLETISTDGWSNGVYIVKLLSLENNKTSQYKLSVLN